MENPTSFDLNAAIRRWQQDLAASPAVGPDNLEELAAHLRDSVQRLRATGLSEAESFLIASRRVGGVDELSSEFSKVNRALVWRVRVFWMCAGVVAYLGASVISNLLSIASLALGSLFLANGYLLGCVGIVTWLSVVGLVVFLFRLVAAGRLTGISSSLARLLRRRRTAVAVFFCGAVALAPAAQLGLMFLMRILPRATAMQVVEIQTYAGLIEHLALLLVILLVLTKPGSRTSERGIQAGG
jgi:hypothetical protein